MCIYFIVNTIGKFISMPISTYGFCVFLHTHVAGSLKQLKSPLLSNLKKVALSYQVIMLPCCALVTL